jgi:site-specific recombinase XerD
VLGLTWDAVDRRSQEIRVADTKNDGPRLLSLTGDLTKLIDRRWRRRIVGDRMARLVFHHRSGRPVSATALRKCWRSATAAAAHPGLIFHDLRRSAVRNMIRAGVSESVAMSISGHQSAEIFRRSPPSKISGGL